MLINITVVTYNRLALTKKCFLSVLQKTDRDFCLNVVDNGSTDGTQEFLADLCIRDRRVRLHRLFCNMGVSVAANVGWDATDADYYIKLDNDVEILSPDWLDILIRLAANNQELGTIGYRFLARHKVCPAVLSDGSLFWEYLTGGACVLIPRRTHDLLGFWNEDYGKYGFEDLEYGERCRLAGLKTGYAPYEDKVLHLGYEQEVQAAYEEQKESSVANLLSGEKMYFLNKFLFSERIRPLYVHRRYLPVSQEQPVRFKVNPEYRAINLLHKRMQDFIRYERQDDTVKLDFKNWSDV